MEQKLFKVVSYVGTGKKYFIVKAETITRAFDKVTRAGYFPSSGFEVEFKDDVCEIASL